MRVYLSGPISGTTDYKQRFAEAAKKAAEEFQSAAGDRPTIVNPVDVIEKIGKNLSYEDMMKIDLNVLKVCDCIYMLKGWKESFGCNREYGYALAIPRMLIFEEE